MRKETWEVCKCITEGLKFMVGVPIVNTARMARKLRAKRLRRMLRPLNNRRTAARFLVKVVWSQEKYHRA